MVSFQLSVKRVSLILDFTQQTLQFLLVFVVFSFKNNQQSIFCHFANICVIAKTLCRKDLTGKELTFELMFWKLNKNMLKHNSRKLNNLAVSIHTVFNASFTWLNEGLSPNAPLHFDPKHTE